ncbi:hypothetical protein RUM44_002286 [Polyplax serrata]|uniref:Uncharacterized protein n=1 Tax=Polyplax serrata TaxID=468196 RepID=A0ABR1AMF6_POLSC
MAHLERRFPLEGRKKFKKVREEFRECTPIDQSVSQAVRQSVGQSVESINRRCAVGERSKILLGELKMRESASVAVCRTSNWNRQTNRSVDREREETSRIRRAEKES